MRRWPRPHISHDSCTSVLPLVCTHSCTVLCNKMNEERISPRSVYGHFNEGNKPKINGSCTTATLGSIGVPWKIKKWKFSHEQIYEYCHWWFSLCGNKGCPRVEQIQNPELHNGPGDSSEHWPKSRCEVKEYEWTYRSGHRCEVCMLCWCPPKSNNQRDTENQGGKMTASWC